MDGANQEPSWQYRPDEESVATYVPHALEPTSVVSPRTGDGGSISWTASEFIAHHKETSWYATLGGGAVAVAFIIWFVTKDVISAAFIVVAATLFGILASRQPRVLTYRVDDEGVQIGQRHFKYADFRSFSVMREGAIPSIVFVPMKRFAQLTTIYYDPQDEPKIISLLEDQLPQEARQSDVVDRLMWRIRF